MLLLTCVISLFAQQHDDMRVHISVYSDNAANSADAIANHQFAASSVAAFLWSEGVANTIEYSAHAGGVGSVSSNRSATVGKAIDVLRWSFHMRNRQGIFTVVLWACVVCGAFAQQSSSHAYAADVGQSVRVVAADVGHWDEQPWYRRLSFEAIAQNASDDEAVATKLLSQENAALPMTFTY